MEWSILALPKGENPVDRVLETTISCRTFRGVGVWQSVSQKC